MWKIGKGEGEGHGERGKQRYKHLFFFCPTAACQGFFRTKWSTTEQASNETVATKSWRYLFANPDRYIIINEVIFSFYSLFYA